MKTSTVAQSCVGPDVSQKVTVTSARPSESLMWPTVVSIVIETPFVYEAANSDELLTQVMRDKRAASGEGVRLFGDGG